MQTILAIDNAGQVFLDKTTHPPRSREKNNDYRKIEGYLIDMGLSFEEVGKGSWLINDPDKGLEQVLVLRRNPVSNTR
jgi:hypothetical protein